MKKTVKIMLPVFFLVFLFYGLQYLRMEFADGADYTEQDKKKYDFYTPKLLKNMPRISDVYSFHYSNVSGPNPALIFRVIFSGSTDAGRINTYLEKNGFKRTGVCNTNGECWIGKDQSTTVSVEYQDNPSAIRVEMIDKAGGK
ncbi:hypothetical protein RNF85_000403 [Salmonella enterica]|nr:hypothetical protein [Salmonella enterica]